MNLLDDKKRLGSLGCNRAPPSRAEEKGASTQRQEASAFSRADQREKSPRCLRLPDAGVTSEGQSGGQGGARSRQMTPHITGLERDVGGGVSATILNPVTHIHQPQLWADGSGGSWGHFLSPLPPVGRGWAGGLEAQGLAWGPARPPTQGGLCRQHLDCACGPLRSCALKEPELTPPPGHPRPLLSRRRQAAEPEKGPVQPGTRLDAPASPRPTTPAPSAAGPAMG